MRSAIRPREATASARYFALPFTPAGHALLVGGGGGLPPTGTQKHWLLLGTSISWLDPHVSHAESSTAAGQSTKTDVTGRAPVGIGG